MQLDLLFLPLLGGYLFFTCFRGTGFRAAHYPAERLLFPCAAFGLVALFLGRMLQLFAGKFDPCPDFAETESCAGPAGIAAADAALAAQDQWLELLVGKLIPILLFLVAICALLTSLEWLVRAFAKKNDPDSRGDGVLSDMDLHAVGEQFRAVIAGSSNPSLKVSMKRKLSLGINAAILVAGSLALFVYLTYGIGSPKLVWTAMSSWGWCVLLLAVGSWALGGACGWPYLSLCVRLSTVAVIVMFMLAAIAALAPTMEEQWALLLGKDLAPLATASAGTVAAMLACAIGFIAALLANRIVAPRAAAAMVHRANKTTHLERLAFEAQVGRKPIQIDLDDSKVYVGFVIDSPTHADIQSGHLALLPLLSGYREQNSRQLEITYHYADPYKKIRASELSHAAKDARLAEFVKVIPLRRITTACQFQLEFFLKTQLRKAADLGIEAPAPAATPANTVASANVAKQKKKKVPK
jgi:hypothetical protein